MAYLRLHVGVGAARNHEPRLIRRAASLPEKAQIRSGLKAGPQLPHSQLITHNLSLRPSPCVYAPSRPSVCVRCPRHECRLRGSRIRLRRRLHKWGTGKENNSSLKLLTPDPCVLTPNCVGSCAALGRIRDRVARQADRPITEKRRWRRRTPPGHAAVRRD